MEALLGPAGSNKSCNSIAELQDQLRAFFSTRVTETSAEHITQTCELRQTAVFSVPVTETENGALENAALLDPQLGGTRSSVAPSTAAESNQTSRHINAIDTLRNQPQDDNVLQKSVAKHIVTALSEVDHSNWTIRGVSRTDQGWTFTYICKDSWQAWTRQNAKTPAKLPIGAWSAKDGHDAVNLSRPSFDCRGHVTIAFLKPTKVIEVRYEHTPIHKSVAQLMELLAPEPPPPVPIPPAAKKAPKEPKAPKTLKAPKRRQTEGGESEGSQPKKRRKKKDSQVMGPDGTALPPEMPGALPVGDSSQHQFYNTQADGVNGVGSDGPGNYPDGLVGKDANQSNGDVQSTSVLNISPEEAARRSGVAIQLLTESGIDPQTLSADQFNIFSNQSPELQKESLAMLVKYGAERLRIVHPNKNGAGSGPPSPSQSYNGDVAEQRGGGKSQSTPAKGSKPKRSRKKKSDAVAVEGSEGNVGAKIVDTAGATVAIATNKAKITRGACKGCRTSKQKCDKEKPSCSRCFAAGMVCEYPIVKSRVSRGAKPVEQELSEIQESSVVEQDDEPDDLPSPCFNAEPAKLPPSPLVSPPIESPSTFIPPGSLYHHPSGLTFPGNVVPAMPEAPRHSNLSGEHTAPVNTTVETPMTSYTYPPLVEEPALSFSEQPPTAVQQTQANTGHQRSRSRRALPSGQSAHDRVANVNNSNTQANSWQTMSSSPTMTAAVTNNPSPRQANAQQTVQNATSGPYDDVRRRSSWSISGQSTAQDANGAPCNSPSQAAAQTTRVKSRRSARNQTQNSVQNASASRPGQSQTNQTHGGGSTYPTTTGVSNSTSVSSYDYDQYPSARDEPASSSVAYEPYSSHPTSTNASNSYPSYGNYNSRAANGASSAHTASQTVASSYNATAVTAPSTSQWGATKSAQPRNTQSYNNNQNGSSGSSYDPGSSNKQPSQALQGFSVRPQPHAQTRSSTRAYGQQTQQPQRQQQQRQQQQQSYNGYSGQPQTNNHQQQNWYGFNAANNPPSGYSSSAASGNNTYSGGSHAHGSGGSGYNQTHHQSMNLSSHTHGSIDGGEQALY